MATTTPSSWIVQSHRLRSSFRIDHSKNDDCSSFSDLSTVKASNLSPGIQELKGMLRMIIEAFPEDRQVFIRDILDLLVRNQVPMIATMMGSCYTAYNVAPPPILEELLNRIQSLTTDRGIPNDL